jgi:hypothetical protein
MKCLFHAVVACTLSSGAVALAQERSPQFKDYPARVIATRRPVKVNIHSTPDTVCFRTRLRETARDGQRFAGHYVVNYWGCGTCVRIGIVDLLSGRSYVTPYVITPLAADNVVKAKSDSRLLLVAHSEAPGGYLYFLWTGRHLLPIYDGRVERREPPRGFRPCGVRCRLS